jgi:predicted amidohydrolase
MKFKAACVQFDVRNDDLRGNVDFVISALEHLRQEDVRLVVLPELWAAKFDTERASELWLFSQEALRKISSLSKKYEMIIAGSLIEKDGSDYFLGERDR